MRHLFTSIVAVLLSTSIAYSAGTHKHSHDEPAKVEENHGHGEGHGGDDHHGTMAAGEPGEASAVTRTIEVKMVETDDGAMLFEPSSVAVKHGETIRFAIVNAGENDHEFVLDSYDKNQEHKKLMEKFPEMEHDDPNSIRLEEGETGEIIWKFSNHGKFEFACLIPGHYELGMKGSLSVASH